MIEVLEAIVGGALFGAFGGVIFTVVSVGALFLILTIDRVLKP
jgi:hypothetical protein